MKDIPNYESLYFATIDGKIFSYPKKTRKGIREIVPHKGSNYNLIDLCKDGKIKKYLIHRLIAETFIPNPDNKPQVNHIDGNKRNNRVDNLEWCTASENQKHSISIGLRTCKGEKNSQSKINAEVALSIFKDKRQYKEISKQYNVSIPTVSDIKRGYSWTHITGIKNIKQST